MTENETTPELSKLADHAISRAKAQMELQGDLTPIFILRKRDGSLYPLKVPPSAAALMDIGEAKEQIFGLLRKMVHAMRATATVFCTDAWMSTPTEKGKALSGGEFGRLYNELGSEGLATAGYSERVEMLICTVQTPERCLVRRAPYTRDQYGVAWAKVEDMEGPVDDFAGRQKMFGDLSEENLGSVDPAAFRAKREAAER